MDILGWFWIDLIEYLVPQEVMAAEEALDNEEEEEGAIAASVSKPSSIAITAPAPIPPVLDPSTIISSMNNIFMQGETIKVGGPLRPWWKRVSWIVICHSSAPLSVN